MLLPLQAASSPKLPSCHQVLGPWSCSDPTACPLNLVMSESHTWDSWCLSCGQWALHLAHDPHRPFGPLSQPPQPSAQARVQISPLAAAAHQSESSFTPVCPLTPQGCQSVTSVAFTQSVTPVFTTLFAPMKFSGLSL